ncbi:hypothetical protein DH2020_025129 [Rehmannia glutinosa]|uniref:EF-hand domain-containing protein n=1 Tax=Rehmannia glutinosa TaxID=99300 RepID=A0ABR0W0K0_REHGL
MISLLRGYLIEDGGLIAYADSPAEGKRLAAHDQKETQKKKVLVLGTGWAGTSFLKDLDISNYDVQVVSPRNYFAFTPLLPSVTCGTVEARSIVEPRNGEIKFWEAECLKVDPTNKKVFCRSNIDENLAGNNEFSLEYDYLIIAIGAQVNTFNTPGVMEHCHFLKEVEDAQRIRRTVIDCFEKAVLPGLTEEERRTNLHFVIVGGGPTGVEFAAELHDFVHEDLVKIYPSVKDLVSITVIQSGHRVMSVSDRMINMRTKSTGEDISIPHGMVVWSTGVGTRPVVKDFMEQIGQGNRRVLATDEWLRVKGCEEVYALGDCATVDQKKIVEDIAEIFKAADKDNSGTLTIEEFQDVIEDIVIRMEKCKQNPEGPRKFRSGGRHEFRLSGTDILVNLLHLAESKQQLSCQEIGFPWAEYTMAMVFCIRKDSSMTTMSRFLVSVWFSGS